MFFMKYSSEALQLQVLFTFNFNLLNSSQNQLKIKGFKELYFVEKFKNRLEANAYLNEILHPGCFKPAHRIWYHERFFKSRDFAIKWYIYNATKRYVLIVEFQKKNSKWGTTLFYYIEIVSSNTFFGHSFSVIVCIGDWASSRKHGFVDFQQTDFCNQLELSCWTTSAQFNEIEVKASKKYLNVGILFNRTWACPRLPIYWYWIATFWIKWISFLLLSLALTQSVSYFVIWRLEFFLN